MFPSEETRIYVSVLRAEQWGLGQWRDGGGWCVSGSDALHMGSCIYMYMYVCTVCLVCTHASLQACTCVKLNPRQQAAIQIRLTGPDISYVGDRCLLQFPLRTFPLFSVLHSN